MGYFSNEDIAQREAEERTQDAPAPLALGAGEGSDRLAPVITIERWPFRAHYLATFRDVAEHRARLQAEHGACEWVCVGQDGANPEIHFRIPNPATRDMATLDELRESLDAVAAHAMAEEEAA